MTDVFLPWPSPLPAPTPLPTTPQPPRGVIAVKASAPGEAYGRNREQMNNITVFRRFFSSTSSCCIADKLGTIPSESVTSQPQIGQDYLWVGEENNPEER